MDEFDDTRFALDAGAGEREVLETFLEFQRDALARKCRGLSDDQLRLRPIPSSGLSLIGLVRHIATVERWYFQGVLAGSSPGSIYDHDSNEAIEDLGNASRAEAFGHWTAEVEASRRVAAGLGLDDAALNPSTGTHQSLRWVLVHMIDEYARHLGHADMIAEAIDGRTGE